MRRLFNIRIRHASIGWYLKQLLPLTYWTVVERCPEHAGPTPHPDCRRSFNIWKMWLGRCYNVTLVPLYD